MFLFTEDCYIGVEEVDKEHQHLFDLINDAVSALEFDYGDDKYSKIVELLEELERYADEHFAHEEAYMEKICDPELPLQRSQHRVFRERIFEFLMRNIDEEENQHKALEDIVNFLAKWLYRHIIGSDTMIGKLPPLEEWMIKENPCEFTEEYMTGIEIIDKEHQILFEIIDRANHMVKSWKAGDDYDMIMQILKELQEYTATHFADEEEYMKNIGYEGYESQRRAHDAFITRLDEINTDKIDENPKIYLESLIEFLTGWLIHHILNADKKIPKIGN